MKKETFRMVDFLASLTDFELENVMQCSTQLILQDGDIVFHEDDAGDSFYIIEDGSIELFKHVEGAQNEAPLKSLTKHDYFGEMALIDNSVRSASAKANTVTTLIRIDKNDFLLLCMDHPNILMQLTRTMSSRLRETNDRFVGMWNSLLRKNKLAAIGTAASKIVHDIKTPITVIVLNAQLLGKTNPGTKDITEKIAKQTRVMDEMVREILDFARGEDSVLNLRYIDFDKFIENVISEVQLTAEDREIIIASDFTVTSKLFIDALKFKRVVVNILKNAMEVVTVGDTIEFSAWECKNYIQFKIKDYGPGIPEDILSSLFEPFVTKGKRTGTGLGLAICKKIVDDHKGKITVHNSDDGGAVFEFCIPKKIEKELAEQSSKEINK